MMSRFREILAGKIRQLFYLQPCSFSHEWIRKLLIADCSLRSMSRIDNGVIVQLEEPISNRMDERVEVSSWKISPAYRLVEESVAGKNVALAGQADTTRRMPWSVENLNSL